MDQQEEQSLSREELYALKLRSNGSFWVLDDKSLVIRDKGKNVQLTRKGVVLTPCSFSVQGQYLEKVLLKCTCVDAKSEYKILSNSLPIFQMEKSLLDFVSLRQQKACDHVKTALSSTFFIQDDITYMRFINENAEFDIETIDGPVAYLSEKPRLIAVHDCISWSVLGAFGAKSGLTCSSAQCTALQSRCSHMECYQGKCDDMGIDPQLFGACNDDPINEVRSSSPIPFPLSPELQTKCHSLGMGWAHHPAEIHPEPDRLLGTCNCDEKNPWVEEICIGPGKVLTSSAWVDRTMENGEVKSIKVFVGVTNKCKCKLSADGQSHALLNVDDRHFLSYSLLFFLLSLLIHGTPSFNLFSNMLHDVYHWCTGDEQTLSKIRKVVRPGETYSIFSMGWRD